MHLCSLTEGTELWLLLFVILRIAEDFAWKFQWLGKSKVEIKSFFIGDNENQKTTWEKMKTNQ